MTTITARPTTTTVALDYMTDVEVWELDRGISMSPTYSPTRRRYMTHVVTSYNGEETMAFGGVVDNGRFRKTVDQLAVITHECAHQDVIDMVIDRIDRGNF